MAMTVEHRELHGELRPGQRVLVVDDHPSFRRCARNLLTAEGFEVVGEAEDGMSAVELARTLTPDLVLLDVQLPDIDGFEVARRLLARDAELPIILVSSRAQSEFGDLVERSGVRGFVSKADLSGTVIERLLE